VPPTPQISPVNNAEPIPEASPIPSLPLMHAAFILAGLGTMLLGPILPLLTARWHLADSQAGTLLLFQFLGATLGGATVTRRLTQDLLLALSFATLGFAIFAFAPTLPTACAALLVGGFGVGRMIASVNIIAGARFTAHRASALSWLNTSWSLGALLSPLTAATLTRHIALPHLLLAYATLLLLVTFAYTAQFIRPTHTPQTQSAVITPSFLPARAFVYFAALLILYGGLETSLSAWLTTYALRYGRSSLVLSAYTLVLLLCGLTAGRALAGILLKSIRETTLLRIALALSAAIGLALTQAHTAPLIATFAVLLGIALAPVFPATFALLMAFKPSASQAGLILAASGIGAATLPSLIGLVSTRTGSLQIALTLPIAAALAMLALTLTKPEGSPQCR